MDNGNTLSRRKIICLLLVAIGSILVFSLLCVVWQHREESVVMEDLSGVQAGDVLLSDQIDRTDPQRYFTARPIDSEIRERIMGKSYRENADISLDELSYLTVLHYNYDHQIQVGELIVHRRIEQDMLEIFLELFQAEYEIHSMYLIDRYYTAEGEDAGVIADNNSISDNNTSAFNYRKIAGSDILSNHALGMAIDINPLQNPYVEVNADGSYAHSYPDIEQYANRDLHEPHMIDRDDLCYRLFTQHGFTWGGDWDPEKDYQHFEK